jgi:hypothetical protein
MKQYRLVVKFKFETFDEVVAELSSISALDRFLSDNKSLATLFKYENYTDSDPMVLKASGTLGLIIKDVSSISEFSFVTYTELTKFLNEQSDLIMHKGKLFRISGL